MKLEALKFTFLGMLLGNVAMIAIWHILGAPAVVAWSLVWACLCAVVVLVIVAVQRKKRWKVAGEGYRRGERKL